MIAHVLAQDRNGPPMLASLRAPVIDLTLNNEMTFVVCERGMASGDPSVIIVSSDAEGSVCIQTSLDKFLLSASGMAAMAETRWGWQPQEGHLTLMPPDKATRKLLIEALLKELQEWDDAND